MSDLFADNPEPRKLIELCLDCSGSMQLHMPLLEASVMTYVDALQLDPMASLRVETAISTFAHDKVTLLNDFGLAEDIAAPTLVAGGGTPLGLAIDEAHERILARRRLVLNAKLLCYTSEVIFLTDAKATDDLKGPVGRLATSIDEKRIRAHLFAAPGADVARLTELLPSISVHSIDSSFKTMFDFVESVAVNGSRGIGVDAPAQGSDQ